MTALWIITVIVWFSVTLFSVIAVVLFFGQEKTKSIALKKCFEQLKPLKTAREIAMELDPCGRGEFIGEEEATKKLEEWKTLIEKAYKK